MTIKLEDADVSVECTRDGDDSEEYELMEIKPYLDLETRRRLFRNLSMLIAEQHCEKSLH